MANRNGMILILLGAFLILSPMLFAMQIIPTPIFSTGFESGTTTMVERTDRGEVVISPEKPITGGYSARFRAFFDSSTWTSAGLSYSISPNIPEVTFESLIRLSTYNPIQTRMLFVSGAAGMLFNFGVQYASRNAYIYVYDVGYIDISRILNINEVYHAKVYLKCSSASGIADGAVTFWLNDTLVYENNAIDNSQYGLITSLVVGSASAWSETSTVDYAEVYVDDVVISVAPPKYYTLSVDTTPITAVNFSLNGVEKITPYTEVLDEGSYTIAMPSSVRFADDSYTFNSWMDDSSTNPTKTVSLIANTTLIASYALVPPVELGNGSLEVHAFSGLDEVDAQISVDTQNFSTTTSGFTIELAPSAYTVIANYGTETISQSATVVDGQVTRLDFQFSTEPKPIIPPLTLMIQLAGVAFVGLGVFYMRKKAKT